MKSIAQRTVKFTPEKREKHTDQEDSRFAPSAKRPTEFARTIRRIGTPTVPRQGHKTAGRTVNSFSKADSELRSSIESSHEKLRNVYRVGEVDLKELTETGPNEVAALDGWQHKLARHKVKSTLMKAYSMVTMTSEEESFGRGNQSSPRIDSQVLNAILRDQKPEGKLNDDANGKVSTHRAREFLKSESTRRIFQRIAERKIRELVARAPEMREEEEALHDYSKFVVGSTVAQFKSAGQSSNGDRLISHKAILERVLHGERKVGRLFDYESDARDIEARTAGDRLAGSQKELLRQYSNNGMLLEENAAKLAELRLRLFNEGREMRKATEEREALSKLQFDQSSKVIYGQSVEVGRRPGVNDRRGLETYLSWQRERQSNQDRLVVLETLIKRSKARFEESEAAIERGEKEHQELKGRKKQLKVQLTEILKDLSSGEARHGRGVPLVETLKTLARLRIGIPKDFFPALLEPSDIDFLERIVHLELCLAQSQAQKASRAETPSDSARRGKPMNSFIDDMPTTSPSHNGGLLRRARTLRLVSHLKEKSLTKFIRGETSRGTLDSPVRSPRSPTTRFSEDDSEATRITEQMRTLKEKYLEELRMKEVPRLNEQPARIETIRQRFIRMFGMRDAETFIQKLQMDAKTIGRKAQSLKKTKSDSIILRPSTVA